MSKRVCLEHGCPVITDKPRCQAHTRAADKARGTRQQRGYDAHHDTLRAQWQRRMDAGETVLCARCQLPITGAWHLDHTPDRTTYLGPSHDLCNLQAAGRISPHD